MLRILTRGLLSPISWDGGVEREIQAAGLGLGPKGGLIECCFHSLAFISASHSIHCPPASSETDGINAIAEIKMIPEPKVPTTIPQCTRKINLHQTRHTILLHNLILVIPPVQYNVQHLAFI